MTPQHPLLLAASCAAFAFSCNASATPLHFRISATVSSVDLQGSAPANLVSPGDTFSLSLVYDPDGNFADPGGGLFVFDLDPTSRLQGLPSPGGNALIGSFQQGSDSLSTGLQVVVSDTSNTISFRSISDLVTPGFPTLSATSNVIVSIDLVDADQNAPTGVFALPTTLNLSDFETATVTYDLLSSDPDAGVTTALIATANITSIEAVAVPEPSAVLLALLASVGLLRRRL